MIAPPIAPYPVIEGCEQGEEGENEGHSCVLSSNTPVKITCSVSGYYPWISLFYQHKSARVNDPISVELNNTDGTRNLSVTITAIAGDDPYVCVASDIPGSPGLQQTSSIYIIGSPPKSTPLSSTVTDPTATPINHTLSMYMSFNTIKLILGKVVHHYCT